MKKGPDRNQDYKEELQKEEGLIKDSVLGKDYFNAPTIGTKYLTMDEIEEFKRKILLYYHSRPTYVLKRVLEATRNYKVFALQFKKIKMF